MSKAKANPSYCLKFKTANNILLNIIVVINTIITTFIIIIIIISAIMIIVIIIIVIINIIKILGRLNRHFTLFLQLMRINHYVLVHYG